MTEKKNHLHYIKCLRFQVAQFLVYRLKNDLITEKRASQIARAVLKQVTDDVDSLKIPDIFEQLSQQYKDESKDILAALSHCQTQQARHDIDQRILSQVESGNIDQALEDLDKLKLK